MGYVQIVEPNPAPSLLQRIRQTVEAVRSSWSGPLTSSSPELARLFSDVPSHSGVSVTGETALTYPAFWAAVSLIAADIASLPLILYKRENGGKSRFTAHPLYKILHDEPNPEMTSMVFRETLQAHVLVWGNAYAEIERDQMGRPLYLWPLVPNRVTPTRVAGDPYGALVYRVSNPTGGDVILPARDVLHLPGLGYDGLLGYSVVSKARESLGLGLAMQQFGSTFFGNGSTFGGVFTTPNALGPKVKEDTITALKALHQGVERAHRFVLLEGGMKYERLGVPPEDAQFLESRSFHVSEVARWFRLSPHKLADLSRATFSNIEHLAIDHVVTCLRPWLVRWEQEYNRKLIATSERNIQFVEHLVDGLLRGDLQSRYAAYAVGRQWGWLSADDVCEIENRNPLPNGQGQIYLVPQNMWPADKADEMMAAQSQKSAPPPAPEPTPSNQDEMNALRTRAEQAEAAAKLAEAKAQEEREARIAVEATTGASQEQIAALRASEAQAVALAENLRLLSVEAQANVARLAEELAAERTIREEAQAAAVNAYASVEREQREREALKTALDARVADFERVSAERDDERTAKEAALDGEQAAREEMQGFEASAVEALKAEAEERKKLEAVLEAHTAEIERLTADVETERQSRESLANALTVAETAARAAGDSLAKAEEAEAQLLVSHQTELAQTAEAQAALAQQLRESQTEIEALRATVAEETAARVALESQLLTQQRETERIRRDGEADVARLRTAIITAHRSIYVEAMGRMVRREIAKAKQYHASPAKLHVWLANHYDQTERDLFVEALLPGMTLHAAMLEQADARSLTEAVVDAHIAASQQALTAVIDAGPDGFRELLQRLYARWEAERPEQFADRLITEEMAHAR